jgi:sulfite reductase (ferredoxin)
MYILPKSTSNDISYFGILINEFNDGKIEEVKFKATRVPLGVYEQRKDGTYMVRIRCTGGFITPDQLKQVTDIAHNHGSKLIHITTRQEIQIQNLQLKDTQLVMEDLQAIGLSSKGGGGNTVRNILASIDTGIGNDELFDVTPYVFDITTKLIDEPDSYTLPRKFKLAFSNTDADTGMAKFNDLGFIARIRNGERGFNVYLGGSLGNKPMVGYELFDFAPVSDMLYIAKAAKSFFSQYGNRKNKHAARLRYVFYKMGKDEVFRLFFEIYNDLKKSEDLNYTLGNYSFKYQTPEIDPVADSSEAFTVWKDRYVKNQKQPGLYSVIVPFEHGNTGNEVLANIAVFASLFGDDVIRFSIRQNVHLRNIPDAYLGNLYQLLQANAIETSKPLLLNTLVSCTGADTCRLGICLSKGACSALKKQLAVSSIDLEKVSGLRINISGCPNSCGQQIAADLGFFGKVGRNDRMYPAYHVVAGARIGKDAKLADILGEISAHDLPKFTTDVIAKYLDKTDRYSSFELYANAEGKDDITKLLANYASIPHFSDNKNYYFDWGSEEIFSLATRGVGECSAGLFDMIDVDLATIQKSITTLETSTNDGEKNTLLSTIIYASSRMLLITRGEEPKTAKDVYNAFIEKFIDDNLIDLKYRDLIVNTRDNSLNDLNSQKTIITDLAQAVIALYEGMDDSLQFKNIKGIPDSTHKSLPITQESLINITKDFRGVACPMNFVKTKVALSFIKIGERLEVLLDDGAPIQNVPGSLRSEGHKVIEEKRVGEHWSVIVEKC